MNPTIANLTRIDEWLDALAAETDQARHSAAFTAYLQAMAKFWRYSAYNSLLIISQCPTATRVNSRKRWEELGYTVKREHWRRGIQILCPHFKTVRNEQSGEDEEVLTHFSTGYIFDLSQVEGGPHAQPLTVPWRCISGDYAALYHLLEGVCRRLSITVELRHDLPDALGGDSNGAGRIRLNGREAPGNRVQSLVHELAHEVIHPRSVRRAFTLQEVECQAEATASCVCQALGMETPNSPMYLALYGVTREVIKANAYAIQAGVSRILREVERVSTADICDSAA